VTEVADAHRLQGVLEELLSPEVTSLTRRPSDFEKRTPTEVVTVALANGDRVELFVKHLGFQVHRFGRHDREPRVYAELFANTPLPVPRYHGTRGGVLVLEHVEGTPLHHHGLEEWLAAARALASLHAQFAGRQDELDAADFLLRVDADYLWTWADRAAAGVADAYPAELATRVERMVGGWDRVVEGITAQPATLVHNHLSPKNVVVSSAAGGSRISIVDWEMAGVGCALEDLVHLRYQRLGETDDRAVLDEYVRHLDGTGLLPANARELRQSFVACELQRIVYKLGRSRQAAPSLDRVAHRVEYAERLWAELAGAR